MKAGKWEKKKFQGREIAGRTLGVIGLGRVGSIVGKLASRGLKMNVLGYDPVTTVEAASQAVKLVSLSEIFSRSHDYRAYASNDETRGLINAAAFDKMRTVSSSLIAPEAIIDENALWMPWNPVKSLQRRWMYIQSNHRAASPGDASEGGDHTSSWSLNR
jgi:D-3-phosphoglycerate dehydrogenase